MNPYYNYFMNKNCPNCYRVIDKENCWKNMYSQNYFCDKACFDNFWDDEYQERIKKKSKKSTFLILTQRARLTHRCIDCFKEIKPNTIYHSQKRIRYGKIVNDKFHLDCFKKPSFWQVISKFFKIFR